MIYDCKISLFGFDVASQYCSAAGCCEPVYRLFALYAGIALGLLVAAVIIILINKYRREHDGKK